MRKIISALIFLTILPVLSHAFTVDGISYSITSTDDNTVKVVANASGYSGNVTIPSEVTYKDVTYTVTAIGSGAFTDDAELTSVSLPSTVKSIGYAAFSGSSVNSVVLSDGLKSIGSWAFNGCTSLKYVNIPSSVNKIGDLAFCGCSSLEGDLVIPDGVEKIAYQAFRGCSSLTSVTIPGSVKTIENEAFMDCTGLTGKVTIPEGVTSIATHAFYNCTGITEVVLPSTLTSLGSWAFAGCTSLESINLPSGLTSIEDCAFYGCSGLKSINISSGIKEIGDLAFYGCSSLEGDLVIPEGVERIAYQAFRGCSSLTSVTIPGSVKTIENEAFMDCTGLTGKVTIPEGVTSIATHAFYNCTGITEVVLPSTLTSLGSWAFAGCTSLESINLPSGLTSIQMLAFYGCSSLKSDIVVPESVTELGYGVFGYCSSLKSVSLPSTLTYISDLLFYDCSSLESVNIPESVTNIGREAFNDCVSLSGTMTIPSTVIEIPAGAFYGCSNITEFIIPESVVKIGLQAFANCTGIESIVIPESVVNIESEAFKDCSSLKEVELGANLETLGSRAFSGCTSLEKIFSYSAEAPICSTDDRFSEFTAELIIPEQGKESYSSAFSWRNFLNVVAFSSKTVWTGAADNDWTNKDNWTKSVPSKKMGRVAVITKVGSEVTLADGTTVTVANYPIIAGTRNGSSISYSNTAECDTIVFEPGAGVLGLQSLDYNKAFVKTRININRWYMISGPLKEMYTGDYYFNGSPVTYLSRFNDALSKTDPSQSIYWFKSCVSLNEPLTPGTGFAYKAFINNGDPNDVQDITLPRTDNEGNLVTTLYKFNPLNGKLLKSAAQTLSKTDKAYRFVVEDDNDNMPSTYSVGLSNIGDYNLIANPVMTHLDIASFINDNSDVIDNGIILVSEETGNTSIISNGSEIISASPTGEMMIAPMQSFFVKRKSDISSSVTFDLENNFTTDNTGNCVLKKSALSSNPALFVKAKNESGSTSYAALYLNSKASNGYVEDEDAEKIFSVNSENEIYTEADGKALDINQFSALPYEAPLSVSADKQGEVTLSFSGAENFENVDVLLVNKQTGEQLNLKNESSYKFAFDANTAKGSLFIRFQSSSEIAGAAMASDSSLKIFSAGSKVKVIGSADNTISEVLVFDAAGRTIVSQKLGNATEYESAAVSGNVVVKVVSERGTTVQKLSIR